MSSSRPQVDVSFAHGQDDLIEEFPTELAGPARALLVALFVAAIALVAHATSLRGQLILNDEQNIVASFAGRGWGQALRTIWLHPSQQRSYSPLTQTGWLIQAKAFRADHPSGYRAISLLLHALAAMLVWALLRKLTNSTGVALAAAAAFAAHPLHSQTITWTSEQRVLLSSVFALSATIVYLRATGIDPPPGDDFGGLRLPAGPTALYVTLFVLFACAALSHPAGVVIPLAWIIVTWWKRGDGRIQCLELLGLVPMIALGVALLIVTITTQHPAANAISWPVQLLAAGRGVWLAVPRIVLPIGLGISYATPPTAPDAAWRWIYPIAAIAALSIAWSVRARLGRATVAAMALFLVIQLPRELLALEPGRSSLIAADAPYLSSLAVIVPLVRAICCDPVAAPAATTARGATVATACVLVLAIASAVRDTA